MHGKSKSGYIATFVERKSGYLMAVRLERNTASAFEQAARECLRQIPAKYRKTLTLDNGSEMADYEEIETGAGLKLYFANPCHSWKRGTNENTNGLLRFYYPKQISFVELTQAELDQAVQELNTRPRKRLGYRIPKEVFTRNW